MRGMNEISEIDYTRLTGLMKPKSIFTKFNISGVLCTDIKYVF